MRHSINLEALFNALPQAALIVNEKDVVVRANAKAVQLLGFSAPELQGQPLGLVLPDSNWMQQQSDAAAVVHLRTKNLDQLQAELYYNPLEQEGEQFGLLSFCAISKEGEKQLTSVASFNGLKKMEAQLKTSEEQLRQVFNTVQDVLFLNTVAADGRIRVEALNKCFEKYTGLAAQEVTGQYLDELMPHERQKNILRKFRQAVATRQAVEWEETQEFPVGERTGLVTVTPICDGEGRCTHLVGSVHDVTVQKQVDAVIRNSEERFRGTFENAAVGIAHVGLDGSWLDVNNRLCAIVGYSKKELLQSTFQHITHPDDLETDLHWVQEVIEGKRNNFAMEKRYLRKDGTYVWANLSVALIRNAEGAPKYFISVVEDISQRKAAEEKIKESEESYRILFNESPLPKLVFDAENYQFLAVNKAALKQYGYNQDELMQMTALDIRPETKRQDFARFIREEALERSGAMGIWQHLRKDGSVMDVEVVAHNIVYGGRKARLVLATDVTEKRRQEAALKQMNKDLHELSSHLQTVREEERTKIARDIHDELGQQLTALKMDAYWLSKNLARPAEALLPATQDMITMIDETVNSVRRIAADLRPQILDDLGLVAALEWQGSETAKRYGINIQLQADEPPAPIPFKVATGLFRIYQEALTNIVRHAEASVVACSLQLTDERVVLQVHDDGKGMDMESQGDKKSFGLIGIRERVFILGGEYQIESTKGQGTCLRVSIPVGD